jgi:membrane protein DedA with SNARE-associated domain
MMNELMMWAGQSRAALVVSLLAGTFISEDGTTLVAVSLAAAGATDPALALTSCFLGIWIGDLGLYALARGLRHRPFLERILHRFVTTEALANAERRFKSCGASALVVSRFVPGLRLPTYLAAGALGYSPLGFAGWTAVCGSIWVFLAYAVARSAGTRFIEDITGSSSRPALALLFGATVIAAILVLRRMVSIVASRFAVTVKRCARWEFWPAWLFYLPVAAMCAFLAIKYRGLALPTAANPMFHTGGIVGESKIEALAALTETSPEFVACSYLVPVGILSDRRFRLAEILEDSGIQFPFVLKPDIAQRGAGFKLIRTPIEAEAYLKKVIAPVILQEYVPGPREVGIFYYRHPQDKQGRIFAITDKDFPVIFGDGVTSLEKLIRNDERASLIAGTYLDRFWEMRQRVLANGESFRLVEAGNHCQGCVFRNGSHLETPELRSAIDEISQRLPGFFIGRYDIRFVDDNDLRAGRRFKILELNGSSAEATSIYDQGTSLWSAYRTLYQQWDLVFAIGRANRDRGHGTASVLSVWREWLAYRELAVHYPNAD